MWCQRENGPQPWLQYGTTADAATGRNWVTLNLAIRCGGPGFALGGFGCHPSGRRLSANPESNGGAGGTIIGMISLRICLVAAIALAAGPVVAQDLDAPLNTKPTIRTEIERGRDAASACTYGPGTDYVAYTDCIDAITTQASASGTSSDPFKLGVDSNAWEQTDIVIHLYIENNSYPDQVADMKKFGWFYYSSTNKLEKKLGLNNKKLCQVTQVHDCSWYDRMNAYWSKLPPP
jgi:hypothetical protein